jgi:tRNA(His) 5'-end guanylyltransferase
MDSQISDEKSETISLGDRMKNHEMVYDLVVPSDHYICIRLDGHGFSKFTKKLRKPYDENFSKAMVLSAFDALCAFSARSAYTQSDEITLMFDIPDTSKGQCYIYNARVQKLLSLTASFVSTRFNLHLKNFVTDFVSKNPGQSFYSEYAINKINNCTSCFDSRILSFDSESKNEILNHLIWRSVKDCNRNAINSYAHHLLGHRKIKNLKGRQMIELLQSEKGLCWQNDVPLWQKYGVFIKKKLVPVQTEHGEALRIKMSAITFKPFFSQEILDFFLSTYDNRDKLQNVIVEEYNLI